MIKLKQFEVNAAYNALKKLYGCQLPVKCAYEIYKLACQLEPMHIFTIERERDMLERYHGTVEPGGTVRFPTQDEAAGFRDELEELNNIDVDGVVVERIELKYEWLEGQKISPSDVASLARFVTFA